MKTRELLAPYNMIDEVALSMLQQEDNWIQNINLNKGECENQLPYLEGFCLS